MTEIPRADTGRVSETRVKTAVLHSIEIVMQRALLREQDPVQAMVTKVLHQNRSCWSMCTGTRRLNIPVCTRMLAQTICTYLQFFLKLVDVARCGIQTLQFHLELAGAWTAQHHKHTMVIGAQQYKRPFTPSIGPKLMRFGSVQKHSTSQCNRG